MIAIPNVHGMKIGELHVCLTTSEGVMIVEFENEGAGFYMRVKTEDTVSLDPEELAAIGQWAHKMCDALDRQERGTQPALEEQG